MNGFSVGIRLLDVDSTLKRSGLREDISVVPRAVIDGESVTIRNARNFDFPSREDFTVRY